jgi:hypothetical protein
MITESLRLASEIAKRIDRREMTGNAESNSDEELGDDEESEL